MCPQCDSPKLRSVHRQFLQRLLYEGAFVCEGCGEQDYISRYARYKRGGPFARCPLCGNVRLHQLTEPDRIDRIFTSLRSLFERCIGGQRFNCRPCRIQFFDSRQRRLNKSQ
jgi:hypothetical protein